RLGSKRRAYLEKIRLLQKAWNVRYGDGYFTPEQFRLLSRYNVRVYSLYPDSDEHVSNVRNAGKRHLFFDKMNKKFQTLKLEYFGSFFGKSNEIQFNRNSSANDHSSVKSDWVLLGSFKRSDLPSVEV